MAAGGGLGGGGGGGADGGAGGGWRLLEILTHYTYNQVNEEIIQQA